MWNAEFESEKYDSKFLHISGIGVFICHARAGGHPVCCVLHHLDSCLRRACPSEGRGMTTIFR